MGSTELKSLIDHIPLAIFPEIEGMGKEERIEFAGEIIAAAEHYYERELKNAKTGRLHEIFSMSPSLTFTVLAAVEAFHEKNLQPLYEGWSWINPLAAGMTFRIAWIISNNINLIEGELRRVRAIKRVFNKNRDPEILHLLGLELEEIDPVLIQEGQKTTQQKYEVAPLSTGLAPNTLKQALEQKRANGQYSKGALKRAWDEVKHAVIGLVTIPVDIKQIGGDYRQGWLTVGKQLKAAKEWLVSRSDQKNEAVQVKRMGDMPPMDKVIFVGEQDVAWHTRDARRLQAELDRIERSAKQNRRQLRQTSEAFPIENMFLIAELAAMFVYMVGDPVKAVGSGIAGALAIRPGQILGKRHSQIYGVLGSERNQIAKMRRQHTEKIMKVQGEIAVEGLDHTL